MDSMVVAKMRIDTVQNQLLLACPRGQAQQVPDGVAKACGLRRNRLNWEAGVKRRAWRRARCGGKAFWRAFGAHWRTLATSSLSHISCPKRKAQRYPAKPER